MGVVGFISSYLVFQKTVEFTLSVLNLLKDLFVLTNIDATIIEVRNKLISKTTLNFMSLW